MFLKVIYKKEVHVYHSKGETSYESLRKYIQQVFKQLPEKFQLTYFDEEDEITLACQSDLETMLQISQKTVKVYITEVDESFYDETQKVVLDDDMGVQPLEQQIQEMRLESQQESQSIQSSEPLLQDSSKKAEIENDDEIRSVSKSDEPLEEKNDQPEIIQEEKPNHQQDFLAFEHSQINSSQISKITEADIQEKFKELMPQFMEKVKKSLLQKSSVSSNISKVVHERITCDECGKHSIEGVRYKCSVCADFDLCEDCEITSSHSHPFLKIKHPKQAPHKIFTIIDDDQENSFEVNGHRVQLPQFPIVNQLFDAFGRTFQSNNGGFNFGCNNYRPHCPFKRNFEKKQEQKKEEEKCVFQEPQKKTKIQQEKPAQKVEPKVEKKPLGRIFERPVMKSKENYEEEKRANQIIIQNSKYLFQILSDSVQEHECYQFARKYPSLTKEELLSVYFSEKF